MIDLPMTPIESVNQDPELLVIVSNTKVGKTSALSQIPNNLIIDLENGSKFITGLKINVKKEALKQGVSELIYLKSLKDKILVANEKNGSPVYDYITIDTGTALEGIAEELALMMYMQNPAGADFKGDSILALDYGAGYEWLRRAFKRLYESFIGLSKRGLIITGHIKMSSVNKGGKEINSRDIQLTGKLKTLITKDADALGFMYRDVEKNENIISFITGDHDIFSGARPPHLKNKEIVISKLKEDGSLETYWENIFQDLKNNK